MLGKHRVLLGGDRTERIKFAAIKIAEKQWRLLLFYVSRAFAGQTEAHQATMRLNRGGVDLGSKPMAQASQLFSVAAWRASTPPHRLISLFVTTV